MLNNREWAILIWGVGIFLILMARREIRSGVGQLLLIVLRPPLLITLLLMVGYVVGEVWLGYKARLWRSDLIKDTIVWFVISALAFFFRYDKACLNSAARNSLNKSFMIGKRFAPRMSFVCPRAIAVEVITARSEKAKAAILMMCEPFIEANPYLFEDQ
jgi:hypothetical protein